LYSEEVHKLYFSPNIIRDGMYSTHVEEKWTQNFVGKSEGKRPLRRSLNRSEDNIKINLNR
jgi:hypothetical protein